MTLARTRIGYSNLGLAWLSFASGCTDVMTFLKLGDVFASAMTGNTALLAIAIGRGQMLAASRSLTALLGFIFGAALATLMDAPIQTHVHGGPFLRRLLLIEIALVLWRASPDPIQGARLYTVILLFAVSMGIQGAGARRVNSAGISTIVFTTLLISIVASLTRTLYGRTRDATSVAVGRASVGSLAGYCCGAALAAVLVAPYFEWLLWMPVVAVLLALGCWELAPKTERDLA
jgi:uncharacterized membrane protein YoaK (UPF0700 family)